MGEDGIAGGVLGIGDCLPDVAEIRAEPGLFGPVASDPTVSRPISLLGDDPDRVEKAINRARKTARARVWALAEVLMSPSITGLRDLTGWPKGMRVIVRREYPDAGREGHRADQPTAPRVRGQSGLVPDRRDGL